MIRKLTLTFVSLGLMTALASAAAYNGNGDSGFSGALGNSTLTVTDSAGTINFSLAAGAPIGAGNDIVFYIDSVAGGFPDTSTFSDQADAGREAISGLSTAAQNGTAANERTLATFAGGFNADYAIVIDGSGNGNLFQLASGGNNSLVFQNGVNLANVANTYTFNTSLASLGLTQGQSFNFVASLISGTAFRSNETIGDIGTVATNPGFTGPITYTNFDTYTSTAVPEPGTIISFLSGSSLLGAMMFIRRRRA